MTSDSSTTVIALAARASRGRMSVAAPSAAPPASVVRRPNHPYASRPSERAGRRTGVPTENKKAGRACPSRRTGPFVVRSERIRSAQHVAGDPVDERGRSRDRARPRPVAFAGAGGRHDHGVSICTFWPPLVNSQPTTSVDRVGAVVVDVEDRQPVTSPGSPAATGRQAPRSAPSGPP